jgi:fatty aldehyde decarbonylase
MTESAQKANVADRHLVFTDIYSYAITGELIGMANYAAMTALSDDPAEQMEFVQHADSERRHAQAFRKAAQLSGHWPRVNLEAQGWRDIRRVFAQEVGRKDLTACLVIQELMLESFAVALYEAVAEVAEPGMASIFQAVARDEAQHVAHAVQELRGCRTANADEFDRTVERLNRDVMHHLAHMVAARDDTGPCGLCQGHCLKEAVATVGLAREELRGRAINQYLRTLDLIGVPGEKSLAWTARLPL